MNTARFTADKRRVRGAASRRAILDAAIQCIANNGLSGTTLDNVAAGAGVSRPLVVFHFKSKERMLLDVLRFIDGEYDAGWRAARDAPGPAADCLRRLVDYDIDFAFEFPAYISVWHAFWGEARGNDLFRENTAPRDDRCRDDLRDAMADLIREGGYSGIDPAVAANGLWAMLYGLWVDAHLYPDADRASDARRATDTFLAALFPRHYRAERAAEPG